MSVDSNLHCSQVRLQRSKMPWKFHERTSANSSALLSAIPGNRKLSTAKQPSKHRCWDAQTRATHWPGSLAASSVVRCLVKVSSPPPYRRDWSGSVRFKSAPADSPALRKSPGMHSASSLRRLPTTLLQWFFSSVSQQCWEPLFTEECVSRHGQIQTQVTAWMYSWMLHRTDLTWHLLLLLSPLCYFSPPTPTTYLSWMWHVYLVTEVASLLFLLLHTSYKSVVNSKTGVNRDWEKDAGLARCLLGLSGKKNMKSAQWVRTRYWPGAAFCWIWQGRRRSPRGVFRD